MAIKLDHNNLTIEVVGDPIIDNYLNIKTPSGGPVTIEGDLVALGYVTIGNVQYPTVGVLEQADLNALVGKSVRVVPDEGSSERVRLEFQDVSYNDLTDKPEIPVLPTLSAVAASGDYGDLANTPSIPVLPPLADVALSGEYGDLLNKPEIPVIPDLAPVATTGDYADLTNTPEIPVVPTLSDVAITGEYGDLLNKPVIPVVPDLAPVALSGSYNDLIDLPTGGGETGGATGLFDLEDVSLHGSQPTTGDVLTFDPLYSGWTNLPLGNAVKAAIGTGDDWQVLTSSGGQLSWLNPRPQLSDLIGVDLGSRPVADGQVLAYRNGLWENVPPSMAFGNGAAGQVLTYSEDPEVGPVAAWADPPTLAPVASSGDYNDLSNKPVPGIASLSADPAPALGADLDVGLNLIKSTNGFVQIKTAGNDMATSGVFIEGQQLSLFNSDEYRGPTYDAALEAYRKENTIAVNGDSDLAVRTNDGHIALVPGGSAGCVRIGGNGGLTGYPGQNIWINNEGGFVLIGGNASGGTPSEVGLIGPVKLYQNTSITALDDNTDISLDGSGTGRVLISGQKFPKTAGTSGQILSTGTGGEMSWVDAPEGSGGGGGGGVSADDAVMYSIIFG